jgi:nucleotide-binding universal stress UspA family protein
MDPLSPLAINHIIVPLDGSRLAEVSIEPAVEVAERCHARVTLLHVLERKAPATIHHDRHLTAEAEADTYLQGVADRFSFASIPIDRHTHPNPERDVAASIATHARELHVDLIVLCTHGQGGPREWMTGSLAQRVIRQAEVPVLLVRPRAGAPAPFAPRSVLTALDGTIAGESILPAACAMARAFDAELNLVMTVPTVSTVPGDRAATALLSPMATTAELELEAASAADYLQRVTALVGATGVPARGEVMRGDAARNLVERAGRDPGCVLALATHGRGGFDTLWAASVGSRVVNRMQGPLLLVRPGHE